MSELQAVAPALGIRLSVDEITGDVRILASDGGGRGEPYLAAFVPVREADGKFRVIDSNSGNFVTPVNGKTLLSAGAYLVDQV
jgi:hypothetical protein